MRPITFILIVSSLLIIQSGCYINHYNMTLHKWNNIKDSPNINQAVLKKEISESIWQWAMDEFEVDTTSIDLLVIQYHHGLKTCGGTWSTKGTRRRENIVLQKIEEKAAPAAWLRVRYGDNELERYEELGKFYYDSDLAIYKIFFREQTICGSHAVIAKNGHFVAYDGEFMTEWLIPFAEHIIAERRNW